MTTQRGFFELEPRHFERGLSVKDFEAYTGQTVFVYNTTKFPHWMRLMTNLALPEKAFAERTKAISRVTQSAAEKLGLPTDPNDWLSVGLLGANNPTEFVHSYYFTCQFNGEKSPYNPLYLYWDAPTLLQQANWDFTPPGSDKNVSYVVPNVFYQNEIDQNATDWNIKFASLAFVVPMTADYSSVIAPGVLRSFVPRRKDIKQFHLIYQTHDLRHAVQAFPNAASEACDYCCELDSDLFALQIFDEGKGSKETSAAFKLHRYFGFLVSDGPSHWTAPALQAAAMRRDPPPYQGLKAAGEHFLKVILQDVGLAASTTSGFTPNDHINWSLWNTKVINEHPELAFPHIIQLHKDGRFKDNPLSQEIAEGVIEAARCFVPEAANKPWPEKRRLLMLHN